MRLRTGGPVSACFGANRTQPSRAFLGLAVLLAGLRIAGAVAHSHGRPNRTLTVGLGLGSGIALLSWNWGLQRRLRRRSLELERNEAQIRATLRAIPDLLFEMDHRGRYVAVQALNPALLVAEQEQLLGLSIDEVMPPAAAATCWAALREAELQGSSHGHQLLLPIAEGDRWFELSVARKQGPPGSPGTYVVLSRDIHARKTAEEERKRQIRFYAVLSRCNEAILHCRSERGAASADLPRSDQHRIAAHGLDWGRRSGQPDGAAHGLGG